MYKVDYYIDYQNHYREIQQRKISLSQAKANHNFAKGSAYAVKYFSKGLEAVVHGSITYGAAVTTGPIGASLALGLSNQIIGLKFDLIDFGLDQSIGDLDVLIDGIDTLLGDIESYEVYQSKVPSDYSSLNKILNGSNDNNSRSNDNRGEMERWQREIDSSPKYDNVNYDRSDFENIG